MHKGIIISIDKTILGSKIEFYGILTSCVYNKCNKISLLLVEKSDYIKSNTFKEGYCWHCIEEYTILHNIPKKTAMILFEPVELNLINHV